MRGDRAVTTETPEAFDAVVSLARSVLQPADYSSLATRLSMN
jgi:hypothetical protein